MVFGGEPERAIDDQHRLYRAWREVPQQMMRRERPYLDRNKDMVRETAWLIAAPAEPEEQLRSGTWSTIRFARKLGKPVFLIFPDGTVNR